MPIRQEFITQLANEVGAQLFWRLVYDIGFDEAIDLVLENGAKAALTRNSIEYILNDQLLAKLTIAELKTIINEAEGQIARSVERQHNIIAGTVYAEDFISGRSPDVSKYLNELDLEIARHRAPDLLYDGVVCTLGKLILRNPLPAVLMCSVEMPIGCDLVKARDTTALGSHYPLYLNVESTDKIVVPEANECSSNTIYVLSGTFMICVIDRADIEAWRKVIPNSSIVSK